MGSDGRDNEVAIVKDKGHRTGHKGNRFVGEGIVSPVIGESEGVNSQPYSCDGHYVSCSLVRNHHAL